MARPALGRGLGALLGGTPVAKPPTPVVPAVTTPAPVSRQTQAPATAEIAPIPAPSGAIDTRERVHQVGLDQLQRCPLQPRKDFPPESLRELADSIQEQGIIQPLIVRERNGHFELIAGERRWRAAQIAGLTKVPVIIRSADDRAVLELALIENLQRENLNPIEEAQGYSQLISQFELTQEDVATKVGKSRALVANALRLLKLPAELQSYLREGKLSVGHAKVLLGLRSEKDQVTAAHRVLHQGLNVRQTETLVTRLQTEPQGTSAVAPGPNIIAIKDPHVDSIEDGLRQKLGTKVQLRYRDGKGAIEISFFSDDELERILQILGLQID